MFSIPMDSVCNNDTTVSKKTAQRWWIVTTVHLQSVAYDAQGPCKSEYNLWAL